MQLANTDKKNVVVVAVVVALLVSLLYFSSLAINFSWLATQFGISAYAAKKIIDIATGAGSVWAIIAVVGGSAGWGAALLAAAKYFVKKFGRAAAASW